MVSKEKSSHPPTNALSVVQDVELVNKLIHAIAGLGDGAQIGHEAHIITLLQGGKKSQEVRQTFKTAAFDHLGPSKSNQLTTLMYKYHFNLMS